ncbi:MAG: hypothetical protein ACFE8Z_08435 [Candidatus Hermodarchaeota archaeon]
MSAIDGKRSMLMSDESTVFLGAAVILFFLWRFARTHQLYRFSLKVKRGQIEPTPFVLSVSRESFEQALIGNRNVEPNSFYVRALVFVTVAFVLLPFRSYAPELYSLVFLLILLYIPWCVSHGLLLRRAVSQQWKDNSQGRRKTFID